MYEVQKILLILLNKFFNKVQTYLGQSISSRSQMFLKIDVLKNLASFTGKHLCWSLFLIKFDRPSAFQLD